MLRWTWPTQVVMGALWGHFYDPRVPPLLLRHFILLLYDKDIDILSITIETIDGAAF